MSPLTTRRRLLRTGGAGLLALGAAPWLTACEGLVRADLPGVAAARPPGLPEREAGWLALAALAPSGHNAQPWTVHVARPGRWIIGSAHTRWLPAVDPDNRELLLSIGAFVENLALAAGTAGYRAEVHPLAADPKAPALLELRLHPADPVPYPLERLRTRCVLRGPMQRTPLRPGHWEALRRHAPAHLHYLPPGTDGAALLDEATLAANEAQTGREAAMRELARWIHWSDAQARRHRSGLTPAAMGIDGVAGWYVRHFYGAEDVLSQEFRRRTLERVANQVQHHGGWIAVTSAGADLPAIVAAGRAFERLALAVRALGLAVHPMSQALEEPPWPGRVAAGLGLGAPVQFLLRVGYVDAYPQPVSLRMPLNRFVTT